MTDRAQSFGSDAESYHRHRPGYPAELVDVVVAHARGEVTTALEVGAGTGKATTVFAARGIHVTAVEPDAGMRAVLARGAHGTPTTIVAGTFEDVDPTSHAPVDLLYAAAAFHWTDPATRWTRAAALVSPGGVVALFGAVTELADAGLAAAVADVEARFLGRDPAELDDDDWPAAELRARPELTDVVRTSISQRSSTSARDYAAHLTTTSAYRVLAPQARATLLARVLAVLPDTVAITQDVDLHLARRQGGSAPT